MRGGMSRFTTCRDCGGLLEVAGPAGCRCLFDPPRLDYGSSDKPLTREQLHRDDSQTSANVDDLPDAPLSTPSAHSVETACTHDGSVHTWRQGCPR